MAVQFSADGLFGEYGSSESIFLSGRDGALRALIRGESGDRLVGGPAVQWSLPNTSVVTLNDGSSNAIGSAVTVDVVASGATVVSVSVGDLSAEVPINVGRQQAMGGATGK